MLSITKVSMLPLPVEQTISAEARRVLAPYGLGYRLKLLSQLSGRRFQERLDAFGLTPFHWVVLCCLWEEDGLATSSISDKLQQVGGTLTGVLDRMAERGLLRRERDAHDRRIWRIWLTQAGQQLQNTLPPVIVELREQVLQGISHAERETLSDLLDRMIANVQRSPTNSLLSDSLKAKRGWQEVLAPYSLGYRVKLLTQLFLRNFQERLDPFGLTPFHWVVLCCLWQEDGLATSSIGDKLHQVGGTLTGVLDRMAERGLINRERNLQDRRIWHIWLTQAGKELSEVLPPVAIALIQEATQGMSDLEQQQFSQWINQAIENVSQV